VTSELPQLPSDERHSFAINIAGSAHMNISTNPTSASAPLDAETTNITQQELTQAGSQKSAKVQKAIKDFEGVFLSMMIKELRQTDSEDGGLFPGDASDTFGGMFDTFMGQELAAGRGVGMESLFQSSHVINQLEGGKKTNSSLNGLVNASVIDRTKAIEGYRNEQLRTGALALP